MESAEEKSPMLSGYDESVIEEVPVLDKSFELKPLGAAGESANTDEEQGMYDPPSNSEKVTDLDASTPGSESPPPLASEAETHSEISAVDEPAKQAEPPKEDTLGDEPHDAPVYGAVTAPLTPEDKPVKPPRMRSMKRDSSQRPVIPAPPTPVKAADVEVGGITPVGDQKTPLINDLYVNVSSNHGGDTLIRPAKQKSVVSSIQVKEGKCSLETLMSNKWLLLAIILFVFLILVIIIIGISVTRPKPVPKPIKPDPEAFSLFCGKVVGVWEDDEKVAAFKGIPYLKPPVGDMRWKKEELKLKEIGDCLSIEFNQTYKAQDFGPPCLQVSEPSNRSNPSIGSEDCLTLNVWTPNYTPGGDSMELPVLVYLDGRMLSYGSVENGPDASTASQLNAVVVSFNYRLNVFGWLATSAVDSNYGLYDCEQALLWVKKYIQNFGGDPNRVTISGLRSAGTLIYTLMKSTERLFQGAWISGASAKLPDEETPEDVYTVNIQAFAHDNGCKDEGTVEEPLNCLKNKTGQELLDSIPWVRTPTWGDHLLMTLPMEAKFVGPMLVHDSRLNDWENAADISLIIGSTQFETLRYQDTDLVSKGWAYYADYVKDSLDRFQIGLTEKAFDLYPELNDNPKLHLSAIVSDIRVHCPNNFRSDEISTSTVSNTTYRYRYVMTADPSPLLSSELGGSAVATHGLDFIAVYRTLPDVSETFKSVQSRLRLKIREFVHSGKVASWDTYPSSVIDISNDGDAPSLRWNTTHCELWRTFYPDYSWIN